MTTLTDRYVWAVLRAVPSRQRDELEPEIRALVADAADAHADNAAPDAAERAALVELGDPDALAARYTDATRFLIGPRLYPEWERLLEAEPELAALFDDDQGRDEWLTSAAELLDSYFALEDPTVLEPAERELFVECDLESGLRLRGYVDRLDIAPGGALRVVDYKTGRAPREGFEAKALFQMKFYALVLWRLRGEVPRLLQLLYLGSGEVLRYEPDEADLRATERKVLALWDAIARATERGDWRPSPSKLCDWCDHQSLCPAFGGTPPELPVLPVPTVPEARAADERPSPHTPGDEV